MLIFYQTNLKLSEYFIVYSIKFDQKVGTMYHEVYLYIGEAF